jgi:flagellar hook protein FlgE
VALTGALFSGVSGVNSNGNALNVIGDNIANINTTGFKAARSVFFDLLSADVGGSKVGRGSRFAAAQRLFTQGGVETTNSPTDLAIQGQGFFVVRDNLGSNFFTRAGQFTLDKDGLLSDPQGLKVQGFKLDTNGNQVTGLTDININNRRLVEPTPTAEIDIAVNLDASAAAPTPTLPGPDAAGTHDTPNDWFAAGNFSTVITTYDSLGTPHDLTFLFRKTATANEWDYRVLANSGEITAGTAGELQQVNPAGGKVAFNADGSLDLTAPTNTSVGNIGAVAWADGAQSQTITAANLHFVGSTQFSLPSSVTTLTQDGNQSGTVTGIKIGSDGVVTGLFSSGRSVPLYSIAMADFASPEGLTHIGNTLYSESTASGAVIYGSPGAGSFGTVLSGSLELSTVDLATEFVKMVTTQRGFQASSRTITVTDTLLEEVANLKR